MKYKIQINRNIPTGLKITFEPDNKIISSFFHSIGYEGIVKTLESVFINHGRGFDQVGFMFYDEIDEEDRRELEIEEEDVLIYEQQLGEVLINKNDFYQLVKDYSIKIVEHQSLISYPIDFKFEIEKKLMMMP